MEDLNKHQLILLTLLVSFVTSIATGIITYTLLQQAPVAVTQTVNRIVERTIEKVVPEEGGKEVVREVQVVSEEDLVLSSIEKSAKSIVRVKTLGFDGSEIVVGLGMVVQDEVVVMEGHNFSSGVNYTIVFQDGKSYNVAKSYPTDGIVYMKVGKPQGEKYTFFPAVLGNPDALKLGQTVIAVGGKNANTVSIGRVSELEATSENSLSRIITDIRRAKDQAGSPLLNLSGEVVGIEAPLRDADTSLHFIPITVVKNTLKTAIAELSKI